MCTRDHELKTLFNYYESNLCDEHTEENIMNAIASQQEYSRLDFTKLKFSEKIVTTEESLRDVVPFDWTEDVLSGIKM